MPARAPKTLKRYDGNPSGHISMDNRNLSFNKEAINYEHDFLMKTREAGNDVPGKYK